MAEAEDVLTDIARHATIYARNLWQRHRPPAKASCLLLSDIVQRLELFILSACGTHFTIRVAQPPAPPTLLARVFRQSPAPWCTQALPATDGHRIWLPACAPRMDKDQAHQWFRVLTLQQAMRARRNSSAYLDQLPHPVARDVFLLIEGFSVDEGIARQFPGMRDALITLRRTALQQRPPLSAFSTARQPLEIFYRRLLEQPCGARNEVLPVCASPQQSHIAVNSLLPELMKYAPDYSIGAYGAAPLVKDFWTGDLRSPQQNPTVSALESEGRELSENPKAARLPRRPEVREAKAGEDKENKKDDAWMVQGDESHPKAEDPMGLQRPIDREEDTAAEEFADLVSELTEARLISTPGQSKEVLLSDDAPDKRSQVKPPSSTVAVTELVYPEWDYRQEAYRQSGTKVCISPMTNGPQEWVDEILKQHAALIRRIQQQFDMLRTRRLLYRQQLDGEEIDLDAYVTSYTDFRAGDSFHQALYQTHRVAEKNIALTLLVDVSGSTDAWIANNRRVIDVEREALLLVAIALQSLGEPYSILAFSGEGPHAVMVHEVKYMNENVDNTVALRISGLQPERFTRVGAALRHATTELMHTVATHRLLIVLSDGKPNDNDDYEGRYGIEDTRQAVIEAKAQGIQPFCLTIDRRAANYLPRIFGAHHYALLPEPERLPQVLLEWMKRLLVN